MLAGTIGSRPVGSAANDRARDYIVGQLRDMGFDVRVQTADARRAEVGLTVRVHNIIAIREARLRDAIALVSHYDSSPASPGAADDALGVAVSLEAARALAGAGLQHALAVIVTDGEEIGLMGAAAIDRDSVASRIGVYLNHEAIGSAGPTLLFETGPGNAWAVDAWAANAPMPRGGSFAFEVYRRIPNDTDFTLLKRLGVPGLNFSAIVDSYPYHTARDAADRLEPATLEQMGHNTVGVVRALDRMDLTRRTLDQATYSDLLGRAAFSMGPRAAAWMTALALFLAVLAWVKTMRASIRAVGFGRVLLTAVWSLIGAIVVLVFMVAAPVLLRASREVYHPWYAHPDRLFLLTALMGALGAWGAARAGALLPERIRSTRHPALAWSIGLPVWLVVSGVLAYYAPMAAYLMAGPLLATSALLLLVPLERPAMVRLVSFLAFAICVSMWGWLTLQLWRFAVAHFGRLPIITPAWVYGAFIFVAGVAFAPPVLAVVTGRRLRRPGLTTALIFVAVVVAVVMAWIAPAYTYERPQRRSANYVHDDSTGRAFWQVAATEPGLDLAGAPDGWSIAAGPPPVAVPVARLPHPFVFRREETGPPALVPARVTLGVSPILGTTGEFTVTVTPSERGLAAAFVMPAGLVPIRPNLPGVQRNGRWTARFGAVPPEGVAFRAFVQATDMPRLRDLRVVISSRRLPGGSGWQGLPTWLPQDRAVWTTEALHIVTPLPEVAPIPRAATETREAAGGNAETQRRGDARRETAKHAKDAKR